MPRRRSWPMTSAAIWMASRLQRFNPLGSMSRENSCGAIAWRLPRRSPVVTVAGSGRRGHALAGAYRATRARQCRAAFQRRTPIGELLTVRSIRFGRKGSGHHAGAGRYGRAHARIPGSAGRYQEQRSGAAAGVRAGLSAAGHHSRRASSGLGDSLGNNAKAIEIDRKALGIVEPLVREHPDDVADRRTLASIEEQLGGALSADRTIQRSLPLAAKIGGSFRSDCRNESSRSSQPAGRRPRLADLRQAASAKRADTLRSTRMLRWPT